MAGAFFLQHIHTHARTKRERNACLCKLLNPVTESRTFKLKLFWITVDRYFDKQGRPDKAMFHQKLYCILR